jgi:N,N'-diacetyllegionaminate synthase
VNIAGRRVGPDDPCFVIAEAGVNHNGDVVLAHALIDAAANAGADAVKFQTFRADRLAVADAPKADYQRAHTGAEQSQLEMLRSLELPDAVYGDLARHCASLGLVFLSTPFDEESADFLDDIGMPAFKIPSGELTNWPFLSHVARKNKPMIISTGMATLEDVQAALQRVRVAGNDQIVLLHCVSKYPASPSDVNLKAMGTLAAACGTPVGYSDHTIGVEIALASVALGACVLEKHLTTDRSLPGPDHAASTEPREFAAMVSGLRMIELARGHGRKEPAPGEEEIAAIARKSLVASCRIPAGTVIETGMFSMKRPGTGVPSSALELIVGQRARVDIPEGLLVTMDMFE